MKRLFLRMTPYSMLAAAIVFSSACATDRGPAANNANRAANNTASVNAEQTGSPAAGPCDQGTIKEKVGKLRNAIGQDIAKDSKLDQQVKDGKLKWDVAEVTYPTVTRIELTVSGTVSDVDKNNGQSQLKKLFDTFGADLKKSCIERVVFEGMSATASSGRFEWNICEYPNVWCNGECVPTCTKQ
ncbi:MAG: hypothetical protein ACK4S4_01295 [Pyrinomonadaceae bacterium]